MEIVIDLDENLPWLTQKTEDPKSNKGNLTFPPNTVNVNELNCKVIKKVATPSPSPNFYINPSFSGLSPLSRKNAIAPQVTKYLEGPTPPFNKEGGGGPTMPLMAKIC